MKYYIIAGEASGDLHGSNLIREIRNLDVDAEFRCYGGDHMKAEGATIVRHISELDFMGFWEILVNLRSILGFIRECKSDLLKWKPDAVILIDYPGFNLRIAEFARKAGVPVFYYVSPQLWAWKKGRLMKIRKNVRRLFVILPFEKDFYASQGYEVDFVGHPLLDALKDLPETPGPIHIPGDGSGDKQLVVLLPGSRKQEIGRILPVMVEVAVLLADRFRFVVAAAGKVPPEYYRKIIGQVALPVLYDQTYDLLRHARAALITSGTATLEAALLNVPQVVCYKANPVSFMIAKKLVSLQYISLVNLILDREVVKELIQKEMNADAATRHLVNVTSDDKKREQIFADYVELKRKLGGSGASAKTASLIIKSLTEN